MATRNDVLRKQGYRQFGADYWIKLEKRGKFMVGTSLQFPAAGGIIRTQRAYPIADAVVEAIATQVPALAELGYEIGARRGGRARRALRHLGPKFRQRVNRAAKRIAALKIVKALNRAKAKVLKSPIATAAVRAAAGALQAFGVPTSVTALALNQARYAAADRAEQGGAAAMVARFSEGSIRDKSHRRKVLREIKDRNVQSAKKALPFKLGDAYVAGWHA